MEPRLIDGIPVEEPLVSVDYYTAAELARLLCQLAQELGAPVDADWEEMEKMSEEDQGIYIEETILECERALSYIAPPGYWFGILDYKGVYGFWPIDDDWPEEEEDW